MKTCTKCNENKADVDFRKRNDSRDGLSYWCKHCSDSERYRWEKDIGNKSLRQKEKEEREFLKKENKKRCKKCKEIKALIDFSTRKDSKDGHRGECKQCDAKNKNVYYHKNKPKLNAQSLAYYYENKEELTPKYAAYRALYREESNEYTRAYYKRNREEILIQKAADQKANPGKYNAKNAKRHAAKLQATPPWLTKEQFKEIEAFYVEAATRTKETGIDHEVDHIIPLQGKEVRGLHVPWNLQILTSSENSSKNNKH